MVEPLVAHDHAERWKCADHEQQRNPPPVRHQHRCHGDERDAVLDEAAPIVEQAERPLPPSYCARCRWS